MAEIPKRACRFVLDLQADTRQELADALYNIASRIERGEMTRGVSGGYSSGYVYELVEGDSPTHDEWASNLRAYVAARKAAGSADASSVGVVDSAALHPMDRDGFGEMKPPGSTVPAGVDSSDEGQRRLMKFYGVDSLAALVEAQAYHIEKLQAKLPQTPSLAPQRVREG